MIIKDNIWNIYKNYDACCVTCNAVIKKSGELVMGAGIAKEFNYKLPGLAKYWGEKLIKLEKRHGCKPLIMITKASSFGLAFEPLLVYFKTKEHWQDQSFLSLIISSMEDLCDYIDLIGWKKILLPAPGCTNGGLSWENEVYPAIKHYLDDYPEIDIIMKG